MGNKRTLEYFKNLLEWMTYYNEMSPFPIYDTEYVQMVENKIKELSKSDIDYDSIPVTACAVCDDLRIEVDELDNDICMRCGTINDIRIFKTIFDYNEYKRSKDK